MAVSRELTFEALPLAGAYSVTSIRHDDGRGWFARSWCSRELESMGLVSVLSQTSLSQNRLAGTLRGLHYQAAPHEETKLVTCVRGRVWDVVVDLRPESSTFRSWYGAELSGDECDAIYVPAGFAHGFLTLEDDSVILYQISEPYVPEAARGIRWDDTALAISWPAPPLSMSDRDRSFPLSIGIT